MCEGVEKFLDSISSFIIDKRGNKKRSIIEKSLDFINSNYHEYELSINEVSEYISMNTSYYSRLFKQEMGITFTEYINKLRVEKAKILLKNSTFRVSEISYKIGFKDPFYFSTIFKKYTGVNPTEYREN
jgi:two-component system response regulator YesN